MKKLVLFLLLGVFAISSAFAQGKLENNPKVMKKRKEFYNKELQLTPAEQKAFWPIYEKYHREEDQLRRKYRPNTKVVDDDQAEAQIKRSFEYDQKKNELKKKYFDEFSEVLPVRKVAAIESTERKFKRLILKEIKSRRGR